MKKISCLILIFIFTKSFSCGTDDAPKFRFESFNGVYYQKHNSNDKGKTILLMKGKNNTLIKNLIKKRESLNT